MIRKLLLILFVSFLVFSCGDDENNPQIISPVTCKPNSCQEANRSICKVVDNKITCECDENYELKNGGCKKKEPVITCDENKTKCDGNILLTCKNNQWEKTNCEESGNICKTKGNISLCVETCENGLTKCSEDKNFLLTCKDDSWVKTNCQNINRVCKVDESTNESSCKQIIPEGMILVEGGTFMMGSEDEMATFDWEKPVHEVTVSNFYISSHEVTNAQYCEFLNAKGSNEGKYNGQTVIWIDINNSGSQIMKVSDKFRAKTGKENHPVTYVTWYGADAYAKWKAGRLPTEAEWEYAARGGKNSKGYKYSGSNNLDEVAWFGDIVGNIFNTHPVKTKNPNELGIYDMSGNVWEWCNDFWSDTYYKESTKDNPTGPKVGQHRVLRGGDWHGDEGLCRVSYRYYGPVTYNDATLGFRIVIPIED